MLIRFLVVVNPRKSSATPIRQEVHYIKKYGLESHMERKNVKVEPSIYIKSLKGKIQYCLCIDSTDEQMIN